MARLTAVPPRPSAPAPAAPPGPPPAAPHAVTGLVRLVDSFGLTYASREVSLPLSGQRLVALLALARRPLARASIADLLWPDHPPERAAGSLRTVAWRVRSQCPGLVVSGAGSLGLGPAVEVDLHRILDGIASWFEQGPTTTAELLGGLHLHASVVELLPGWYDDWVLLNREVLHGVRVAFLSRAAEVLAAGGEHERALDLALAAVSADPYDEQLHTQVAAIHLEQGNVSEALRQYDMCAALFRRELGMEPSRAFRAMLPVTAIAGPLPTSVP